MYTYEAIQVQIQRVPLDSHSLTACLRLKMFGMTIAIGLSLPRHIGICIKYIKLLIIIFIIVLAIVGDTNYCGAFVASCP